MNRKNALAYFGHKCYRQSKTGVVVAVVVVAAAVIGAKVVAAVVVFDKLCT
jgi:hypothetical protein